MAYQENGAIALSASLRWHYPNQVAGIISALAGTPCYRYVIGQI